MAIDFHNHSMFKEFFSDTLVVKGLRENGHGVDTTIPACVFTEETAEALDDLSLASNIKEITAVFDDDTWRYYEKGLQVGDKVGYDNRKYEIREVFHENVNGWQIKAREVK